MYATRARVRAFIPGSIERSSGRAVAEKVFFLLVGRTAVWPNLVVVAVAVAVPPPLLLLQDALFDNPRRTASPCSTMQHQRAHMRTERVAKMADLDLLQEEYANLSRSRERSKEQEKRLRALAIVARELGWSPPKGADASPKEVFATLLADRLIGVLHTDSKAGASVAYHRLALVVSFAATYKGSSIEHAWPRRAKGADLNEVRASLGSQRFEELAAFGRFLSEAVNAYRWEAETEG